MAVLSMARVALAQPNDISVGAVHSNLLGALGSPSRSELTLAYHRYLDKPSIRLGMGMGWQNGASWNGAPIDVFGDAALVFRGPSGWRPFVGLEAGWTGFNQLTPQARIWPDTIVRLHQRSVSHLYLGTVVAPLLFRHRWVTVSSLAVHIAELGVGAHYLRVQLELLQLGATW